MILLNISNLEWVPGRLKRNQTIFQTMLDADSRLTQGVFLNPPRLVRDDVSKYYHPWTCQAAHERTVAGKTITVISVSYTLWDWHVGPIRAFWASHLLRWLKRTIVHDKPYLLWLNTASRLQASVAVQLAQGATKTVFDWSDDFRAPGFGMDHANLMKLTSISDGVLCVNESLRSTLPHPNSRIFHNCTSPSAFSLRSEPFVMLPLWPKPQGATYIGFTGGIHMSRVDVQLLGKLFRTFPEFTFVFVGYSDGKAIEQWLSQFSNVHYVAEVPHRLLTFIIRSFDVAIVPHEDNEYTRGNDLLKVLDYFACAVPVVTTRCSGVERYGSALYLADTHELFCSYIELITSGSLVHDPSAGLSIAQHQSWDNQVPTLLPWIQSL